MFGLFSFRAKGSTMGRKRESHVETLLWGSQDKVASEIPSRALLVD